LSYELAATDDPALIDGFIESVAEAYEASLVDSGHSNEWIMKVAKGLVAASMTKLEKCDFKVTALENKAARELLASIKGST
jgi:hypothetical protein